VFFEGVVGEGLMDPEVVANRKWWASVSFNFNICTE
jgi:hypothetical protein